MHGKQIVFAAFAAGCLAASAAAAPQNNPAEAAGSYESLGAVPAGPTAIQQQMQAQMKAAATGQPTAGAGQIQIDPAILQQIAEQINKTAVSQQAKNRPGQAALQQQMQAQMQATSAALQQQMTNQIQAQMGGGQSQGQMQLDSAMQQGIAKKMEEAMRQGRSDTGAIQEMQKKIMTDQMQKNVLQESIQPAMLQNVQKQVTGTGTAAP